MSVTDLTDFQPVPETIGALEAHLDRCRQAEADAQSACRTARSRFATQARLRYRAAAESTLAAERALTDALNEGRR